MVPEYIRKKIKRVTRKDVKRIGRELLANPIIENSLLTVINLILSLDLFFNAPVTITIYRKLNPIYP